MTQRGIKTRTVAIVMAATIVALTAASLFMQALGSKPDVAETLLPIAFAAMGGIVAARASGNPLGWLFLAVGLLMSGGQAGDSLMFLARDRWDAMTMAKVATILTGWVWLPTLALMTTFCLLLFPDGRLPSRRWRPVAWIAAVNRARHRRHVRLPALLATLIAEVSTLALPADATLAITRYRLYDIDRIVSRTVGWGVLTLVLGGVYLTGATLLTSVTATAAGGSPFAVAAATLATAAAFGPARRRIQSAVDRRFNRARYDVAKTADAYRARLRDQLDLESIADDLLRTARSTVHPTATVVWLIPPGGRA